MRRIGYRLVELEGALKASEVKIVYYNGSCVP